MDLHRRLGAVIRSLRQSTGLSQEALAERAGLHRTYISLLERGLKSPSVRVLDALARVLGVMPHELLEAAEAWDKTEPTQAANKGSICGKEAGDGE